MMKNSKPMTRKLSIFFHVLVMLAVAAGIALALNEKTPLTKNPDMSMVGSVGGTSGKSEMHDGQVGAAVTAQPLQKENPEQQSQSSAETEAPVQQTQVPDEAKAPTQRIQAPDETEVPTQQAQAPAEIEAPTQQPHASVDAKVPSQQSQVSAETDAATGENTSARQKQASTVTENTSQSMQASEKTAVPAASSGSVEDLKATLEQYISKQKGRYGLYYKNLVTGQEFGICEKEPFIAASTTKLPMNLLLYRKVAAGEIDLQQKLTYLQEDFEAGTGIIQASPYGTEYTVRETARLSIVCSDNCGINMIIRLLGIENIRKYMQDLGGTIYYERGHRSCPYDLAVYAEELYRFYQQDPETAGILMEDLQNTQWNDRINKLLPEDVKVPHKIGNYPGVYNDVGIVFASEPYVLAVMSDGVSQDDALDVIAQLSRMIYNAVEKTAE